MNNNIDSLYRFYKKFGIFKLQELVKAHPNLQPMANEVLQKEKIFLATIV